LKENIDILHAMKDALMKYETIDAKQIDDLMARQPVREPRDAHDRHEAKPEKEGVSKDKAVDEIQKPTDESKKDESKKDESKKDESKKDESKKDETNLDDKAE